MIQCYAIITLSLSCVSITTKENVFKQSRKASNGSTDPTRIKLSMHKIKNYLAKTPYLK